jgi:Derlin-2/3
VCVAGHAYYFLEDVYPRITGRRPLKTPGLIQAMFPPEEIRPAAVFMEQLPEELQRQLEQQLEELGIDGQVEGVEVAGPDEQRPQQAAAAGGGQEHED